VREQVCIVTGRPHPDCAHFPARRSHGGESTLLNMVPLSRSWHQLADEYESPYRQIVTELALSYHKRLYESGAFSEDVLGKPYWR
jgi:hypothetical protein